MHRAEPADRTVGDPPITDSCAHGQTQWIDRGKNMSNQILEAMRTSVIDDAPDRAVQLAQQVLGWRPVWSARYRLNCMTSLIPKFINPELLPLFPTLQAPACSVYTFSPC